MAQSQYTEGVPSVSPSVEGGAPYQSARGADAEAFGGGIAQGLEKLGQGAQTAGKFFGKVAADNASNDFQDFSTKLLHGDPNKTVTGPDGSKMPDTGYLGLKGRAALDARPDTQKAIDDKIKELREGLTTPEQQQEFDNFSRRYRSGVVEKVGTHADGQATTWYQGVNTATAKLAMDHISNNFDNPNEVAAGAADLTSAYVKNAQLKGGSDVEIKEATAQAKRDALAAQLQAMAVNDPSRAMSVLDKNREIAGVQYDNLATQFRTRAEQQQGIAAGTAAIKKTYDTQQGTTSGYTDVSLSAAGAPYGVSGSYLARVHQIEGDGTSSTGAKGPFQFTDSTAKQYGLKDPFNPQQAADAAARLAADNRSALTSKLGRPPTDPELYLAHQQGAGGAAALLSNPTLTAQQALMTTGMDAGAAARAIRVNGGDPNAPASAFTGMWAAKFVGAPGAAVAMRKASAMQDVLANPDLSDQARAHAISFVNQQMAAQKIAMEEDAASKKAASDKIQSDFVTQIIQGSDPSIIAKIAASPLGGTEKENLYNFATAKGGIEDTISYGPSYVDAMHRILLPADDASKLYDVSDVVRMQNDGKLTKKGADEIIKRMNEIKKNPDEAGITTTRASQLKYYQSQMGIDNELGNIPGEKPFKNQKGVDKFNHEFVPAVESAYGQWKVKGGDPMEFWNDRKRLDAIMDNIYPPAQRKADSLFATGAPTTKEPPPPPPAGVEQKAWDHFMTAPPNKPDGTPWAAKDWGKAIEILRADPSEKTQAFFDKRFGPSGYTAKDILSRLPPAQKKAEADIGGHEPTLLQKLGGKIEGMIARQPSREEKTVDGPATVMGVRG